MSDVAAPGGLTSVRMNAEPHFAGGLVAYLGDRFNRYLALI